MDKTINVIWKSYHKPEIIDRGYWDNGLLEDTFKRGKFKHYYDVDEIPQGEGVDWQGAVFIINGRTHFEDVEAINNDIAKLRWCLMIITGDEEALFPWQEIKHPLLRRWVMLPRMNLHNDVNFKLPNGYRPTTKETLKKIGYMEKTADWFFAGQVNHARREQCVEAIKSLENQNGILVETDGFGKEVMAYHNYLRQMAGSKIVFCPSGIESPDNFRVYEALEAGCVPVVDAFATNNPSWGFWQYLFRGQPPFPIIPYWSDLPALLPQLLKDYPENANRCFAWWQKYKRDMFNKLTDTIKEISK